MKAAFALLLLLSPPLAGPTRADTSGATQDDCAAHATYGQTSADCAALRVAFREKLNLCLEERRLTARQRTGGSGQTNAHSSRASYVACASETRQALGLAE
jgi:hypothetical protein